MQSSRSESHTRVLIACGDIAYGATLENFLAVLDYDIERCHEAPFVLEHGQVVGRLVYERMAARPEQIYGAGIASSYQGQGLKLSKHFRTPPV